MEASHFSASLAHMGLLSGVHTHVNRQRRSLNELLAAVGVIAHVRSNAAVYPFCRRPVSLVFCVLDPIHIP